MVGQKVPSMLKITVHDTAGQLRLELEGRLTGAWVAEVDHCWHTASYPNKPLAVDLTGVVCVDRAGRYLLQLMHRDGASFVATDIMLQDILDYGTDTAE
jgi:hypothetical protein